MSGSLLKIMKFVGDITGLDLVRFFVNLPDSLKAGYLLGMGTVIPFHPLWFLHIIVLIIATIIVNKLFFKTKSIKNTLYSIMIGFVVMALLMYIFYYYMSKTISTTARQYLV